MRPLVSAATPKESRKPARQPQQVPNLQRRVKFKNLCQQWQLHWCLLLRPRRYLTHRRTLPPIPLLWARKHQAPNLITRAALTSKTCKSAKDSSVPPQACSKSSNKGQTHAAVKNAQTRILMQTSVQHRPAAAQQLLATCLKVNSKPSNTRLRTY